MTAHDHSPAVEEALAALAIETPTWGYGLSGTRFAKFTLPGQAGTLSERLEDAAHVHRLTGCAGAVALHLPWDVEENPREALERHGLRAGTVSPNLFVDPEYRLGSLTHPDAAVRDQAIEHVREAGEVARDVGARALALWLGDGTNYPGQDDLRGRRRRLLDSLERIYADLHPDQELLLEYKLFEPACYATDLADWGSSVLLCQKLGDRARVLVDLGHHAHGVNIEQIVAILADEGRLGAFHFNNRKYADDDLVAGSVNPFELFLIFCELAAGDGPLPRLTIDQAHNVEDKLEAMTLSVTNLQAAYAKALLVDRAALAEAQAAGDVVGGHAVLLDAYETDVRPLCAHVRTQIGAAADPLAELRSSGHRERTIAARA